MYIASQMLNDVDACQMLCALYDVTSGSWDREAILRLPIEVCPVWVRHHMVAHLRHRLLSFSERALYHARNTYVMAVFVDWSPFDRSLLPQPIAEYGWVNCGQASVKIHDHFLLQVIAKSTRKRKPVVRLVMHSVLLWHHRSIIHPEPLIVTEHQVFPAYLL
jgi:hypothetical protein